MKEAAWEGYPSIAWMSCKKIYVRLGMGKIIARQALKTFFLDASGHDEGGAVLTIRLKRILENTLGTLPLKAALQKRLENVAKRCLPSAPF